MIVHAAIQEYGTLCTYDENDLDSFSRLLIINSRGGVNKLYTTYTILIVLVNKHGWRGKNYVNLATASQTDLLSRGYTIHSHKFGMGIPTNNSQLIIRKKYVKNEQTRLKSLNTTFVDEY